MRSLNKVSVREECSQRMVASLRGSIGRGIWASHPQFVGRPVHTPMWRCCWIIPWGWKIYTVGFVIGVMIAFVGFRVRRWCIARSFDPRGNISGDWMWYLILSLGQYTWPSFCCLCYDVGMSKLFAHVFPPFFLAFEIRIYESAPASYIPYLSAIVTTAHNPNHHSDKKWIIIPFVIYKYGPNYSLLCFNVAVSRAPGPAK